jgi:hypothetical protein
MPFPTVTVTPGSGQTINTLPNAGQATSANSLPVVVASDQSAVPVSAASLPLPAGAATAANQPALNADGGALVHVTNFPATQPVSGTVTANLGTLNGAAQDGVDATGVSQLSGGAGIRGWLSGIFSKLSGTLSVSWSGQSVSVSNFPSTQPVSGTVTANAGSGNFAVNNTQIGGSAISSAAAGVQKVGVTGNAGAAFDCASTQNIPTSPNMIMVGAEFNTTPATITTGNSSPLQLDSAANLLVNVKAGSITANAGTNLNTSSLALESGGNLAAIKTQTSTTAAGTSATSALPVQGVSGGVAIPVSAASLPLPSNAAKETGGNLAVIAGAVITQGSTTSGQPGELIMGAVTTTAPSYTTGQTSPLSLDTSGNLRVNSNITQISGSGLALGQAVMASSIPVVIASNQGAVPVSLSGISAGLNTRISRTPTINTTAYSTGQNLFAVDSFSFFRSGGPNSGLITGLTAMWTGSSSEAVPVTFYIFNAAPTTLSAGANISGLVASDFQKLVAQPLTITPTVPSGITAMSIGSLSLNVSANASAATLYIYVGVGGAVTPAASGDFSYIISGVLD